MNQILNLSSHLYLSYSSYFQEEKVKIILGYISLNENKE